MGEQSACEYCGTADDLEVFSTSKGFSAIQCRDMDACWQRQKAQRPQQRRRAAAEADYIAALREQLARVTAENTELRGLLREVADSVPYMISSWTCDQGAALESRLRGTLARLMEPSA